MATAVNAQHLQLRFSTKPVNGRLVIAHLVIGRFVTGRYVTGRFVGVP